MTYSTIDTLPDLSAQAMQAARTLTFEPLQPSPQGWTTSAAFNNTVTTTVQNDLFMFTGVADASYSFFSHSTRAPSMIKMYDQFGNVIAIDNEADIPMPPGDDYLGHVVAPYSGTYYVAAGWTEVRPDPYLSLNVHVTFDRTAPLINTVNGTAGRDILGSTIRNDIVDGGAGDDILSFGGPRTEFNLVKNGEALTVTSRYGNKGMDVLRNIERIDFSDAVIDLKYAGLTQALYVGYFGRAADVGGLTSFQAQLSALGAPSSLGDLDARYATDAGIRSLVDSFGASTESQALYKGDNMAFVDAIYHNLLGRAADPAGLVFWSGAIDAGSLTRANASLSIMAGAQSNTTTQGLADARLVEAKISVASNFTFALEADGMGAAYDGAGAAAVARDLLGAVGVTTNPDTFQPLVRQAILKLPVPPPARGAPEQYGEQPWTQEHTPITLTGIDSGSLDGAAALA